jgi:hypothetical protein
MSLPMMSSLLVGMVTTIGVLAISASAVAAELPPPEVTHVHHQRAVPYCGPCGCLRVSYVYHRQLQPTYGLRFDPRNFDQTQPYYHLGPSRAYPRYWIVADPMQ